MAPAAIAASEFTRRRAWLSTQVEQRQMARDEANTKLLPWLHLAAMAGARIAQVHEAGLIVYPYDRAGEDTSIPLVLDLSMDQRRAALADLALARDHAVAAAEQDPRRIDRARGLCVLARHLGAPAHSPIISQRAAASGPQGRGLKQAAGDSPPEAAAAPNGAKPSGADAPRPAFEGTNGKGASA